MNFLKNVFSWFIPESEQKESSIIEGISDWIPVHEEPVPARQPRHRRTMAEAMEAQRFRQRQRERVREERKRERKERREEQMRRRREEAEERRIRDQARMREERERREREERDDRRERSFEQESRRSQNKRNRHSNKNQQKKQQQISLVKVPLKEEKSEIKEEVKLEMKEEKSNFSELRALKEKMEVYECPITCQLIRQPVITPCGHTFESDAIREVLTKTKKCPTCRANCRGKNLAPNYLVKKEIQSINSKCKELGVNPNDL